MILAYLYQITQKTITESSHMVDSKIRSTNLLLVNMVNVKSICTPAFSDIDLLYTGNQKIRSTNLLLVILYEVFEKV